MSAVAHGYAAENPLKRLPKAEKPRPRTREAGYFTDAEIAALLPRLEGVYRVLVETAVQTGARFGELAALTWDDLDLTRAVMHVRRTVTDGGIVHEPKGFEKREVDLTPGLVATLGSWWGECGGPTDDCLVFPGEAGYLVGYTVLRRELYPAMKTAGIARKGPGGVARTFHSLRHTHARIALETGCDPFWLSRRLGHSTPAFTLQRYGHWSRAAARAQLERLAVAFVGNERPEILPTLDSD
jgi:integrase